MSQSEIQARIIELDQQIAKLPSGSITKKTVNGRVYFYHRWTQNKKRKEKYIPLTEVETFRTQIERRKALEKERDQLKKQLPKSSVKSQKTAGLNFSVNVRIGDSLRVFSESVRKLRKRECYQRIHDFVYGEQQDKVWC